MSATWSFADCLKEGESKSWANPRISTDFCPRRADSKEKAALNAAPRKLFARCAQVLAAGGRRRKARKKRAFLTWHYEEMLVRVPVMSGQVEAKPAHIEQKSQRSRGTGAEDGSGDGLCDGPLTHRESEPTSREVFREQRGKLAVKRTSYATFFRPILPFMTVWSVLRKQSPRSV